MRNTFHSLLHRWWYFALTIIIYRLSSTRFFDFYASKRKISLFISPSFSSSTGSSASSSQFLSHSCPSPPRHSFSKGLKRKRNGRSLFFFFQTKPVVPDSTTTGQSDPLDPLSSLMSGTPSQRYQDYVSPRSLSTDSSTTESPVHEEQGFGQNYGNYFPTPGVLPSILYSQLYGNQFQNSESPEQRAVADSCSVRQEEVRPDNNVWRPY